MSVPISFEVFPPHTLHGFLHLRKVCSELNQLAPGFFSVTFGAGGSAQQNTLAVVRQLVKKNIRTVPHISCINMTKKRLKEILYTYIQLGIQQLLVVRGDRMDKAQQSIEDFSHASDMIEYIRQLTGDYFHITVAAYPEFHPEALNIDEDLKNFRRKVVAGADSAITQFFFNSDAYFRFKESCQKLGLNIPIVPGIMPISNYEKLAKFAAICGAEIPLWLRKRLQSFAGDAAAISALGIDVTTSLCEKLIQQGAEALHFYTLNQASPTKLIYQRLLQDNYALSASSSLP